MRIQTSVDLSYLAQLRRPAYFSSRRVSEPHIAARMKRRSFPGVAGKSPPRARVTSAVTTIIVAGITYALIVRHITPNYADYSAVTVAPADFAKQSVRDAYVAERVKLLELENVAHEHAKAAEAKESTIEELRESVASTQSSTPTRKSEATSVKDISRERGYDDTTWRRIQASEPEEDECHTLPLSDYWGPQQVGVGSTTVTNDAECCTLCKQTPKCRFWRTDPTKPGSCFTGVLPNVYMPPMYGQEHEKKTTSGTLYPPTPKYAGGESEGLETCVHTMITSNGSPYMNWQTRIFYETWKKAAGEKDSILRRFTRVLHRSREDELMTLIPTWRVDPTHKDCDVWCDYAVKDRARAIYQWSQTEDAKQCSHILMAETDYLFIRSPPPSIVLAKGFSYGFMFGYIVPSYPNAKPASLELHDEAKDGPLKDVYQTGNAPQCIHRDDLERVSEVWAQKVEFGETSETVKKIFGWVRDMYAWSFAAAAVRPKLEFELPPVPFQKLMIQPPADIFIGQASLMHYTWGTTIKNSANEEVWSFDKRSYRGTSSDLIRLPSVPEWDASKGYKLQDEKIIQQSQYEVIRKMVDIFNEAVDAIQ